MDDGIDQWTAGELALRTIVSWMIDGRDGERLREFVRWLVPSDMVQTEHLFILSALQALDARGEELSIERLKATLVCHDPAGFVMDVLDRIVENRALGRSSAHEHCRKRSRLRQLADHLLDKIQCWIRGVRKGPPKPALYHSAAENAKESDDAALDEIRRILIELRQFREQESLRAMQAVVHVAQRLLNGELGIIDGSGQLVRLENIVHGEERQVFEIFRKVVLAAPYYPQGQERKQWATDALNRKDRERAELEASARPEIEIACRTLIDRMGSYLRGGG